MSTKVKIILGVIGLLMFAQVLQVASKTPMNIVLRFRVTKIALTREGILEITLEPY